MILALTLILVTLGLAMGVAAIGGTTWTDGAPSWLGGITRRGWVTIACLVAAFLVGAGKEILSSRQERVSAAARSELDRDLRGRLDRLEYLLTQASLRLVQTAREPQEAAREFRKEVAARGFPAIAEKLYRPAARYPVNLRTAPTVGAPVAARIEPGTPFRVTAVTPEWAMVELPTGVVGWVASRYIEEAE
jgi:SH3 domain-containing protein